MSDPERLSQGLHHAAEGAEPRPVDVDAVLEASRASRRRRRTAIIGGATGAVAVVAVAGLVLGLQLGPASTSSSPEAGGTIQTDAPGSDAANSPGVLAPRDEQPGTDVAVPPLSQATGCGAPLPKAGTTDDLELTVVDAVLGADGSGEVIASLSNPSDRQVSVRVEGTPAVAIAADGATVWVQQGTPGEVLRLDPDASATVSIPLAASDCRADGTPLEQRGYDAVVVVDVVIGAGDRVRLVSPVASVSWLGS